MHILTVIGARPQFIKAAAVARALEKPAYSTIRQTVVHTGQHYDQNMSESFFKELDIPQPDMNLSVKGGSHGAQTGAMMTGLEDILQSQKPDLVLVYGDTNSTLAGALVASKAGISIAHVEAGLRSFRIAMPEEVNRVIADRLSKYLLCPTQTAVDNLKAEGRTEDVHLVGDVMYDVFLYNQSKIDRSEIQHRHGVSEKKYVLSSIHRAENTDDPDRLKAIFEGLQTVAMKMPVVLPLHPRTRSALKQIGFVPKGDFKITDPLPYREMMGLLCGAAALATDSGGMQKEAYFARVPCVTLRDETEWVETLVGGWNRLMPPEDEGIRDAIEAAVGDHERPAPQAFYGCGDAAEKILSIITETP